MQTDYRVFRLGLLLALTALGACTRVGGAPGEGAARHPWTIPGVLRVALAGTPKTLNPILSTTTIEALVETFALDPLVATDPEGRDVPILAQTVPTLENGGISKDGLTIVYHLRHGVRWHDGAPFTSRDVKFSFAAIMNPNTMVSTRHGYDDVARIDTPDAYTVVLHLKHPFAPAIETFFAHSDSPFMILPAHLLERYKSLDRIPFNEHPIGTGPFRVVRWDRGNRIDYVANDDYFLGKPKLKRIEVHFVQDENSIVNQLRSHEIDWFFEPTNIVYQELKAIAGLDNRLIPYNGFHAIQFNTARAPFDDPRVRRAVGLAIDKNELAEKLSFGTAEAATEDIPRFMWAFDPTAGTTKHDLPAARALLDAAGWRADPSGIRRRNGRPLAIGLAYQVESAVERRRVPILVGMLHEAGIAAEPKGYNESLLYASAGQNGILASGNFEAVITTWFAGVDPDDSTQLLCNQFPPTGWNWSRYCDRKMDAAQGIALSHYDRPTRKRAYAQIEELLAIDAPFIYLLWPRQIEPINTDFKNFRPNGIVENWNSYQWSI
jgi:peptide/nickel transport system substrate-binding protein